MVMMDLTTALMGTTVLRLVWDTIQWGMLIVAWLSMAMTLTVMNKIKNLEFRSSARAPSQGSATISTSDPNMGVGYEVPLGCLRVAGEEFENFDFSTVPTKLLTKLRRTKGTLDNQKGPFEVFREKAICPQILLFQWFSGKKQYAHIFCFFNGFPGKKQYALVL